MSEGSEEPIAAELLPHFTPSSLHALWDNDGGLIVSTTSRLPERESYNPNIPGQLDYTRPRLFPDGFIYMAFYPRTILNRGPIFGRLNLSSAELSLAVVRYPRGSGRFGQRVHGLQPELLQQWIRLEDVLHEMVRYLLRKLPSSLPEIIWPQLPYQYGYRELHELPEHAIRCAQKAKEAFVMLGALLSFVLALWAGPYRTNCFRPAFEQLLQWPSVTFTEEWLGHLEQSQVCDLTPGLRAGLFVDPYSSRWGNFLENFVRVGVPIWVLWGPAERYRELQSSLKVNNFPMALFPPNPNQIEILQARAASKPTASYGGERSSSNLSVPFDYDPPDIIHYKHDVVRPGERRDQMLKHFFEMRLRRLQKGTTNASAEQKDVIRRRIDDATAFGLMTADCKVFGWETELGYWRRVRYNRGEALAQTLKCTESQRIYWPDVNEWDLCPFLPKDGGSGDSSDPSGHQGLASFLTGIDANPKVDTTGEHERGGGRAAVITHVGSGFDNEIASDNTKRDASDIMSDRSSGGERHEFPAPTKTFNSIEEEMTDNGNGNYDVDNEGYVNDYGSGYYGVEEMAESHEVEQPTDSLEPGEIASVLETHTIFFDYLFKRHGFRVAPDHRMNQHIHTQSDLHVTNANAVAQRLNYSDCQVPSHFSAAIVDFYNILAYSAVQRSDLPPAFDIAQGARDQPQFTRRNVFVKVIRGNSAEKDLFIFEDMGLPTEHWVISLSDPTAVLFVCRSTWDTLEDIVKVLLRAGIKFGMPCRVHRHDVNPKVNLPVLGLGSRAMNFKPKSSDFNLYKYQKKELFSSSIGRLFRTHGGLLSRLSEGHVLEYEVLQGPYRFDTVLADLGHDIVLADNSLEFQHIAIACGVFLVDTTPAGDKYVFKSFWPLPSSWDTSGMNIDGWSPAAEIFYSKRLQKSRSALPDVLSASVWKSKSGIKRYVTKMRPILASARNLARDYIDEARLSTFRR